MAQLPLFDVYFTGKLVADAEESAVKAQFSQLFKVSGERLETFFTGKPCVLKRGVDRETAQRYKAVLHKAGMLVTFKVAAAAPAEPVATPPTDQSSSQSPPQTPEPAAAQKPATATDSPRPIADQASPQPSTATEQDAAALTIAPVGSDVLQPQERREHTPRDIDTSNIRLVSSFMEPVNDTPEAPPAPDTSHISVAATGEDLLVDKPAPAPTPDLNLEDISLAPAGADLEQLVDALPPLDPDISHISIAEVGADILTEKPDKTVPPPPDTSHLSVAEDSVSKE